VIVHKFVSPTGYFSGLPSRSEGGLFFPLRGSRPDPKVACFSPSGPRPDPKVACFSPSGPPSRSEGGLFLPFGAPVPIRSVAHWLRLKGPFGAPVSVAHSSLITAYWLRLKGPFGAPVPIRSVAHWQPDY
jgi:hypothetical protein